MLALLLAGVLSARAAPSPDPAMAPPAACVDPEPCRVPAWALPTALSTADPEGAIPAEQSWASAPVARHLHPVAFHYGRRYQALLAAGMGGPRASSVFGPVVARADVHWRLLDATGRGLDLDADEAATWRDTALAGSILAADDLLEEMIGRAPVLYAAWVFADTLVSPSFDLREDDHGRIEVLHRPGGANRRALDRASEELADVTVARRGRPPPRPRFGVGLDWELRDADAPTSAPLLRYTAWLDGTNFGISSFRAELAPSSQAWILSGREQLRPNVYLIGSARSVDRSWEPGRLSGGLMWSPRSLGSCTVRAERIVSLEAAERRWMVTLRCENHTPIPAPLAPALGDIGRGGPTLPWAPERDPNEPTSW